MIELRPRDHEHDLLDAGGQQAAEHEPEDDPESGADQAP